MRESSWEELHYLCNANRHWEVKKYMYEQEQLASVRLKVHGMLVPYLIKSGLRSKIASVCVDLIKDEKI